MQQLSLFKREKPDWETLTDIAKRFKIRFTQRERKDPYDLLERVMARIGPMFERYCKANFSDEDPGLKPVVEDIDAFMFYLYHEA